jgi:hypothetical protein
MVPTGRRLAPPDDRLRTRPGISRFRVRCGACHRAALRADPLASPRNDGVWVASLAMTFESKYDSAPSPRDAPEPLMNLSPHKKGVGNAGCPLHPRPRVRFVVVRSTRVTTSTPESPGIPARNGFNGLCRDLPGDRALLPPSSAEQGFVTARLGQQSSANLTPASGRQDHTILPYASASFVSAPFDRSRILVGSALHHVSRLTLPRPPHPHPASVTIAIRPSGGVGCESCRFDLG